MEVTDCYRSELALRKEIKLLDPERQAVPVLAHTLFPLL